MPWTRACRADNEALTSALARACETDCTTPVGVPCRQIDKHCDADSADEIADVDNAQCAQNLASTHLAAGAGHDHQSVAGKQFGASDNDEDQPQREHKASQEADHP